MERSSRSPSENGLSDIALLGLVAVLAVAVRSTSVQVRLYQSLQRDKRPPERDVVLTGTRERFVPALAGLLAAAMALVPFVVLGVATGLEIVMPLAAIVLDGLLRPRWRTSSSCPAWSSSGPANQATARRAGPTVTRPMGPLPADPCPSGSAGRDLREWAPAVWLVAVGHDGGEEPVMRNGGRWAAVAALVLSVGLTGCGASRTTTSASAEQPAQVETISGKDVKQVRLTDQAVKRLGIETTTVAAATQDAAGAAPAAPMMTVPYSAVIYSADGVAWVYTVPSPRNFIREKGRGRQRRRGPGIGRPGSPPGLPSGRRW